MSVKIKNIKVEYAENPVGVETVTPRFSWQIESDEKNILQEGYRITVKRFIDDEVWDTGFVASDETMAISYRGETLTRDTPYYVTLTVRINGKDYTVKTEFRTGLLGYIPPHIGWIRPDCREKEYKFSPYMRREFTLNSDEIAFATAYVSAQGWYELYFNGESVDPNAKLLHSYHREHQKVFYTAYDVTKMLKSGKNAVGVQLGNGYSDNFRPGQSYYGGKRFWAFISVTFTDGSFAHIITDDKWKWSKSPVIFDHIYDGEWYDARLEQPGWNKVGFNDKNWENVTYSHFNDNMVPLFDTPVRVLSTRPVSKIKKFSDNKSVYDFKYNGSGMVKIKVKGDPGAEVKIVTAENILPGGELQKWTNRNAEATQRYFLKGEGEEEYLPHFTYHCFRYAEITTTGNVEIISVEAPVYGTDIMSESSFESSSEMLNRINANFERTLRTNFFAWPADTGARDERTCCDMDLLVYLEFAIHKTYGHNYFEKWLSAKNIPESGNADWSGASVLFAWFIYKYYRDKDALKRCYDKIRGLCMGMYNVFTKNHFSRGYGDWCAPKMDNEFEHCYADAEEVNCIVYILELDGIIDIAKTIGEDADIPRFLQIKDIVKKYLFDKYFDEETGLITPGRQTPTLLAVSSGIFTSEQKDKALKSLIKQIREKDNSHLSTGIFGTRKLLEVLSETEEGRETVYDILHQTTYPSYGKQIVGKDATTAWEQWYGLQGMMTCSHSMFTGIGVDFYKILGGIRSECCAYKKIIIEPKASDKISFVNSTLATERGLIVSNWKREDGKFKLHVSIPANSTAAIILPDGSRHEVGSGEYDFVC